MPEESQNINSKTVPVKIALILTIIFAVVFAWFAARWQIGDLLAELTALNDANVKQSAAAAIDFAPRDPLANWLAADAGKPEDATAGFEKVVRLAPNDFRWRVELAKIYEQSGDVERAEKSLGRAAELAPNYAYPRWQLGNFYLRQNRGIEAFAELKKAVGGNDIYPTQVYSLAWDYFDKNTAKINELAGDSAAARKDLVKFYLSKERPNDALDIFNSLSENDRKTDANFTKLVTQTAAEKRFFKVGEEFARQSGIDADAKYENVTNGGFEKEIPVSEATYFNWRLTTTDKLDIKTDATQKHSGNRSLRLVFSGFSELYFSNIIQIAAVQSSVKYRLSFWAETENLKSAGTPNVEIVNACDNKLVAVTKPLATGTNDWQQMTADFAAPDNCDGIFIKLGRAYCGEKCPIYGTVRLDDFALAKQ